MHTPKYQLTIRAVVALSIALAGSFCAVPALAEAGGAEPAPSSTTAAPPPASAGTATPVNQTTAAAPAAAAAEPVVPGISDAGLAEALRRDLGLTLEEFNAAGQLGRTAADALPSVRHLPGYLGISLRDGKILVEGSGVELQARVDQLNAAGTAAVFELVAPAAGPSAVTPAAPLVTPAAAIPAVAPAADKVASSTEQLFQDYIREVGPTGLQAVAYSGGSFIIRTGGINAAEAALHTVLDPQLPAAASPAPAPGKISAVEFAARYKNVQLEKGAPVKTEADVYGGEGYIIPGGGACSAGFGAYSPEGESEILTAGHCAGDGATTDVSLEDRASAPAAGAALRSPVVVAGALGSFGFSQFGGPGNTAITGTATNPGNVGTDIAIIKGLATGISTRPAATKWDNVTNPEPTSVKIIGTMAPFPGQAVCRSGRTTGWKCGTVNSVGIWAMPGPKSLSPKFDNDLRAVHAFDSTSVKSDGGDSGGPWISGNFAVGTHTGAETEGYGTGRVQLRAIAATLEDALTKIPTAVQLQLFLNKPVLVAPENLTFKAGQPITGRVPAAPASAVAADSTVRITVGSEEPVDVPVDKAGNWTYTPPATPTPTTGLLAFTAETRNKLSRSGAVSLAVKISGLDAPVIGTPVDGAALKAVTSIGGTGTPGLTVKLTGAVSGSAVVAHGGNWSIPVTGPVYGRIAVHAVQTSPGAVDSPSVTRNFTVAPGAPSVTTILDGSRLSQDALPATIDGTGLEGADVAILIDGLPVGSSKAGAAGAGGRWSVEFPAGLVVGAHTLSATQSVDGVASEPLLLDFTVDARIVAPAAAAPAAAPVAPAAFPAVAPPAAAPVAPVGLAAAVPLVQPAAGPVIHAATGQLADTGAGFLLPAAGLAGGALLLGGILLILARRRTVR